MVQLATYQQRDGIFGKHFVKNNAKTMAPATWWSQYGKVVPLLSSVACTVLAQTVCASPAERNWSVYGHIKTAYRSRLQHGTANKLVYSHETLHLRTKRQKAGFKEKVVKWESDSDSDESDDEKDFMV